MDGSINKADQAVVTKNLGRTLGSGKLSDRGNIVGWCGELYEESTGMWLARHRWQIPELGRWANRDPISYAGGGQSLYEYVNGNPIEFVDPWGLAGQNAELCAAIARESTVAVDKLLLHLVSMDRSGVFSDGEMTNYITHNTYSEIGVNFYSISTQNSHLDTDGHSVGWQLAQAAAVDTLKQFAILGAKSIDRPLLA